MAREVGGNLEEEVGALSAVKRIMNENRYQPYVHNNAIL